MTREINPDTLSTTAGRSSWITTAKTTDGRLVDVWFTDKSAGYDAAKDARLAMASGNFHGVRRYRGKRLSVAVTGRRLTMSYA